MKKQMILPAICAALLLGGGLAAQAQPGLKQGAEDGPSLRIMMCPRGDSAPERLSLFERLDLSEAQHKEIQTLLNDSMERSTELHANMREVGRKLRQVMAPNNFDEKVLRKLASEKSAIETELIVDRAKTHSRIYALFTPEQKELADLANKLHRLQGHGPMHPEKPMPRPMCMKPRKPGPAD